MVKRKQPATGQQRADIPLDSSARTFFEAFGWAQEPGKFERPYAQHPWVHATVRCIARALKGVPIVVKQGTRGERVPLDARVRAMRSPKTSDVDVGQVVDSESDPVVRLFLDPNPMLSRAKLWEATALHLWLTGGSVWVKIGRGGQFVSSANEMPVEVWPMPMSAFEARLDNKTLLPVKWRGTWGSGEVLFDPHQLVFFKFLNPYSDYTGLAPMKPAGISAEADWAAMSFNAAFFQNGADVGGIIKTKSNLRLDQARAVLDTWNDQFQGHRKAHKTAVLTGDSEFVPNTRTQRDMEFQALRDSARREIMATLGPVPPILLGLSDDYTRATAREAEAVLFDYTLLPEMRDIEDVLEREIGNWTGGTRWMEFNLTEVQALQQQAETKADPATKFMGLGIPLRQVNEMLDLGLDVDALPHADEAFLASGLRLASDVVAGTDVLGVADNGNIGGTVGGGAVDPAHEGAGASATHGDSGSTSTAVERHARGAASLRVRAPAWRNFVRAVTDPAEARGVRAFKLYVSKLRNWTVWKLANVMADATQHLRDDATPPKIRLTLAMAEQILFAREEWDRELRRIMAPFYRDSAALALKHLREELGKGIAVIAAEDPRVVETLAAKEIKVVQINATIRTRLREVLMAAVAKTEAVNATAAEIQQEVGQGLKAEFNSASGRALAIARTEGAQVANEVRATAMKAAGVTQHEWVSAQDAHVRESHEKANGEVRVIGQAFSNGLTHPGQIGAPAEEVINCFVPGTQVEGRFVAGSKAWYSGPVWEIETARGYRLTVTANHPVATARGWLPARLIQEGDTLFSHAQEIKGRAHRHVDHEDIPSAIDDVFEAIGADGTRGTAMVRGLDFHGDAAFMDREIDIVSVHRDLWTYVDATIAQLGRKFALVAADAQHAGVHRARAGQDRGVAVTLPAACGPRIGALTFDGVTVRPEARPLDDLGCGPAAHWHAPLAEKSKQRRSLYPLFVRQLLGAAAGCVAPDDVVRIRRYPFAGHVFDLQSVDGWLLADGIVSSNCRCVCVAVVPAPTGAT